MIKLAAYSDRHPSGRLVCRLCPSECRLKEGQRGLCFSRYNQNGSLVTDNYGEAVSLAIDPIEKKPLYHFYPGADIFSTGPNACNLKCAHCQNWTISQERVATRYVSPERMVQYGAARGSIGVAFTYTEPLMWFEYLLDVAPLLHEAGLKVVLVTNGYINPRPLEDLLGLVDAANIDLKSFDEHFYRRVCKGKLAPVLDSIRAFFKAGVHLELTTLLIPGHNESGEELTRLTDFVADISPLIPLHLSAYYPAYQMNVPPTSAEILIKAKTIAEQRLKYVYVGNMHLPGCSDTKCPGCGAMLIRRNGYNPRIVGIIDGRCRACGFVTGIRM